ncbi:hypothetical protein JR316_0002343 [Psilocybe cubensis]|uniref:Mitochondrial carrier n=2 Tax=Psilocybe cubensis TaxID=181762 RepID=A0A8H7Y5K1_PSICU|nr:hypothetical protein JR316_0002343 [Psilocybe cubensis]KAH9485435.1 hypothetical protein JR316_0002343 [Psilocybe cubensis]
MPQPNSLVRLGRHGRNSTGGCRSLGALARIPSPLVRSNHLSSLQVKFILFYLEAVFCIIKMSEASTTPDALTLLLASAITLAIFVPLTGVLVRFRANYNPKGLQLDSEGGAAPHTGPVVHSYIGMMSRVYRLEGWAGLYKGLVPTALSTFAVSLVILFAMDTQGPRHGKYRAPETGILGTLFYSLLMLVISLPTSIITYRSITTPHKLSYFNAVGALRVLLTPTERRRPWIIYLTPGLMAAESLHVCIIVLFLGPMRRMLLPGLSERGVILGNISLVRLVIYLIIFCGTVLALTPLEVIATRLAIQRNHASAEYNSVSQEVDGDAEDTVEYSGTDEDVIGLRHEGDPYLGLVDCAKRIIDEEGWMTLYRAWWITMLGGLGSSFV